MTPQLKLIGSNELFCHLSSERIANFVRNATSFVCFAGPGVHIDTAKAMVDVVGRIGAKQLIVSVDFDERVIRMGYGDLEAIRILRKNDIVVNHAPGLRSALIIVDREGYIFLITHKFQSKLAAG